MVPPTAVGARPSRAAKSLPGQYEVLRLYGGLYVDCDLLWLGATMPAAERHTPTEQLLNEFSRGVMMIAPESVPHADSLTSIGTLQLVNKYGTNQTGRPADGMTILYLNTGLLVAPAHDPELDRLLDQLPPLERDVERMAKKKKVDVNEWRVTGPEAFNRLVASSLKPIVLLPLRWLYPYHNNRWPPPPMRVVRDWGLTWGELKPVHRIRVFNATPVTTIVEIDRLQGDEQFQCVWDGARVSLARVHHT